MAPMTNRVKVRIWFYGLAMETNNFALEFKADLSLNYTFPGGWVVGLGGLLDILKIKLISAQPS